MNKLVVLLLFAFLAGCVSTPPVEPEPKIVCKPRVVFLTPDKAPPVLKFPDHLLDNPEHLTKEQLVEIIAIQQAYIKQYSDYLTGF